MLDIKKLIDKINKSCDILFVESSFYLQLSSFNHFRISGDNSSIAINNNKNSREEVTVIKWFKNFWVYLEIKFEKNNTFITVSVFQGNEIDYEKNQLFRAEWDDYNNPDEKHPQPHWHITSNQAIENTFKELIEGDKEEGFAALLLNEEKTKIIDVNKIHFAMNGNWINDETHIHSINDEDKIVKWFQGLFTNMKEQLEYVLK